ncbi:MAG TPA: RNA polymerase subunit sigma-24, partial [Terriglobales bacterium]|nr:RNA polymerase subunit sigma-24 [Terriglobales bacterium]
WDGVAIAAAIRLVERAGAMRRPGPYQLQAAIAACHAEAPSWADTDWPQIVVLYDLLLRISPSPVVRLNRAVALRWVAGSAAALAEVDALSCALDGYHLFHAARAELLQELGRPDEARTAEERALSLTANRAERALLERRLGGAVSSPASPG